MQVILHFKIKLDFKVSNMAMFKVFKHACAFLNWFEVGLTGERQL